MNWYVLAARKVDPVLEDQAKNRPWEMTPEEFQKYHYTGFIDNDAYRDYRNRKGLEWVKPEKYPQHYATLRFGGIPIEIRRDNKKNRYCAHGADGEILRQPNGLCVYMTDEEVKAKGYALEDGGLAAFDNGECVGFASNEFGSTGLWVVEDMQRKGLGTYLLREFRKTMPQLGRLGQMTSAGINATRAYHRSLVNDAMQAGRAVPDHVRKSHNL